MDAVSLPGVRAAHRSVCVRAVQWRVHAYAAHLCVYATREIPT